MVGMLSTFPRHGSARTYADSSPQPSTCLLCPQQPCRTFSTDWATPAPTTGRVCSHASPPSSLGPPLCCGQRRSQTPQRRRRSWLRTRPLRSGRPATTAAGAPSPATVSRWSLVWWLDGDPEWHSALAVCFIATRWDAGPGRCQVAHYVTSSRSFLLQCPAPQCRTASGVPQLCLPNPLIPRKPLNPDYEVDFGTYYERLANLGAKFDRTRYLIPLKTANIPRL